MTDDDFLNGAGLSEWGADELVRPQYGGMIIIEEDICNRYHDDILREYRKVCGE